MHVDSPQNEFSLPLEHLLQEKKHEVSYLLHHSMLIDELLEYKIPSLCNHTCQILIILAEKCFLFEQ